LATYNIAKNKAKQISMINPFNIRSNSPIYILLTISHIAMDWPLLTSLPLPILCPELTERTQ